MEKEEVIQKRKCIICLEEKPTTEFTPEHVFPSAMGGGIIIYNVCAKCNTDLGVLVDQPLLRHEMVSYYRNLFNLTRNETERKGSIPNPFKNARIESNGKTYIFGFKNNKPSAQVIDKLEMRTDEETGILIGNLTIASDKMDSVDDILKKLARRQGYEITEYTIGKKEVYPNETLTIVINAENNRFIFGCLKIAYESMCHFFPNYVEHEMAGRIRSVLRTGNVPESLADLLNETHGPLMDHYEKLFSKIQGLREYHHATILENVNGVGLVCAVKIFSWFYPVLVAKDLNYIPEGRHILIYNDASSRQFSSNMLHRYTDVSFTTETQGLNSQEFEFLQVCRENSFKRFDRVHIYNNKGHVVFTDPIDFAQFVMAEPSKHFRWSDHEFKVDFNPTNYLVRFNKFNKYLKILGMKINREIILQLIT